MVIYARIDPDLEKRFRHKVIEKFGSQKAALERAVEEAIKKWLQDNS